MKALREGIERMRGTIKTTYYPWFREMTRIMVKSFFVITLVFALMLFFAKEMIPLWHVVVVGVLWGYTIAITYWLLKEEPMSEKWTNFWHFMIWFMFSIISGVQIIGLGESVIGFLLFDYWIIRGIQIFIARKSLEVKFNNDLVMVKDRWKGDNLEVYERLEGVNKF